MLTRLATGRALPARSHGVSLATLAQLDSAARQRVIGQVRPLAIQGTSGLACFRCLRHGVVVIVLRGREVG